LLVIDLFRAHRTEKNVDLIKKLGWRVAYIPGGCTSIVQVHDLYVNKPFKTLFTNLYLQRRADAGDSNATTRQEVVDWVIQVNQHPEIKSALRLGAEKLNKILTFPVEAEKDVEREQEANARREIEMHVS